MDRITKQINLSLHTFWLIYIYFNLLIPNVFVRCDIELVLVQVLSRHGDRSSVDTYPSNPNRESMWPQGYGQLTKTGMEQQYMLGTYFRDRYILGRPYTLLNEHYSRYQIHIESTDYDRTLMSAYCHLTGMYPPDGNQKWNKNITWQPVPVHTEPTDIDHVLLVDGDCPQYDKLYEELLHTDIVKQEEERNKEFYDFVAKEAGVPRESIADIWKIFDTLLCETLHPELGFVLPAWVNKTFDGITVYEKLAQQESFQFTLKYNTTEMQRLRGGSLVGRVISNMKARINATDLASQIRKYYIFSAHDTTVAAFLSTLQVYNKIFPPYTATVMLELLNDTTTGQYYVQIMYKNDSTALPYNLTIRGCDKLCPLGRFMDMMLPLTPEDWQAECALSGNQKWYFVLLAAVGVVFIISLVICIVIYQRRSYSTKQGRFSQLPVDS